MVDMASDTRTGPPLQKAIFTPVATPVSTVMSHSLYQTTSASTLFPKFSRVHPRLDRPHFTAPLVSPGFEGTGNVSRYDLKLRIR